MATFDAHKNFAYSTVTVAPSPASSGTSLTVATGDGAKFPAAPFNATVWPAGGIPLGGNAEIVRVTGISGDVLTVTRAQESTSARTVLVGDQIAAAITAKTLTDVEAALAWVSFLPLPSGNATTDTANLNTVLARGGRIVPNPLAVAASYTINGTLILAAGGNTDVDFGACTITMATGVAGHLLETSAFQTTGRNVPDVQIASGVATATCIQAPYQGGGSAYQKWTGFLASDAGKSVVVRDNSRPQANGDFATTISSVSSNTLVGTYGGYAIATLAAAPGFTPSGGSPSGVTFLSIGPRDQNVTVRGGNWVRTTVTGDPQDSTCGMLWFARCDGVAVRDVKVTTQTNSSYQVVFEDVTNYVAENTSSTTTKAGSGGGTDLVHVSGPATNGTIGRVFGTAGDDVVGLNAYVWGAFRHCAGPITKLTVRDVFADGQGANTVSCWVSDWYNATCDDITVESCRPVQTTAGSGHAGILCSIETGEQHQINCGRLKFVDCSGSVYIASNGLPSSSGNGTITGITLANHHFDAAMIPDNTGVVNLSTHITLGELKCINTTGTLSGSGRSLVRVDDTAQITSLLLNNTRIYGTGTLTGIDVVLVVNNGGAIGRTVINGGELSNTGTTGEIIKENASGANAGEVWLSDFYTDSFDIAFLQANTTRNVNATNIHATGTVGFWVSGTDTVTFRGANVNSPAHTLNTNSSAIGKVQIPDMLADSAWTAPTLQNSWANIGAGFSTAGYRKDGLGYVRLKGVLASGTTTAGTLLFTLPAKYRPSEQRIFSAPSFAAVGYVYIATNGQVTIQAGNNTFLSLDGISFLAEA